MNLKEHIEQLRQSSAKDLAELKDLKALEALRIKYLGRNGAITAALDKLREVAKEERAAAGKAANEVKTWLVTEIEALQAQFTAQTAGPAKQIDITLPGRRLHIGKLHPLTQVTDRL